MKFFPYKTRNLKGALLYVPKDSKGPIPLVIWLTDGKDGAQMPTLFSLGRLLKDGDIRPDCAVLMPVANSGHDYMSMTADELLELVTMARGEANLDGRNISLCGWDKGAIAATTLARNLPYFFNRICLISYCPKMLEKKPVDVPLLLLIGGKEQNASWDWLGVLERMPTASLLVAENYGHEIGDRIWSEEGGWLIRWLTAEGGGRCYRTSR